MVLNVYKHGKVVTKISQVSVVTEIVLDGALTIRSAVANNLISYSVYVPKIIKVGWQ